MPLSQKQIDAACRVRHDLDYQAEMGRPPEFEWDALGDEHKDNDRDEMRRILEAAMRKG